MEQEIDRKIERLKKTTVNIALAQDGADQSKLDTIRGTIAALSWMKGVPKHAESTLQKFLQEQGFVESEISEEE
jgi:ribosomal protein L5